MIDGPGDVTKAEANGTGATERAGPIPARLHWVDFEPSPG